MVSIIFHRSSLGKECQNGDVSSGKAKVRLLEQTLKKQLGEMKDSMSSLLQNRRTFPELTGTDSIAVAWSKIRI